MMKAFTTNSPEETMKKGEALGQLLKEGDVLTLSGDLGAGKTHFTKGVAKGLGVKRVVNSPTFVIIKEYNGRLPLYHMDVYRLEGNETEDLGFDEYFEGDGVTIVEWASIINEFLPPNYIDIVIKRKSDSERLFHCTSYGKRYETLLKEWLSHGHIGD